MSIVGGGTAGCVVASRLSEDVDVSVLVIDKGHAKDNIISRMPLISQNMFLGDILQVQSDRWSDPMPGANGRRSKLWAVEGIGGASRMNAMLWTRGYPGDYAAWSELGLNDWTYDKMEPYFQRIENAVCHPNSDFRGHQGPMELRQYQYPFVWTKYIDKAAENLGLRSQGDLNNPTAPAMGLFTFDAAIDKHGNRISALSAYLSKVVVSQRRDRLTICTGAAASRLETNAKTGLATGVYIRSSKGAQEEFFVKARREIIVCSGAICTPQLLLLSGIGPKTSLEQFDIPLIAELPVGCTLWDHYSIPVMLQVLRKETFHILQSIWGLWHLLLWLLFGKGLVGFTAMTTTMYLHTDAIDKKTMHVKNVTDKNGISNLDGSLSHNVPDIEIMLMPNSAVERVVEGMSLITLHPTLVQPRGSGRVELASTDALAQPRITYPLFSDNHDIASARLAVRFTMRLADMFQHSGYPYPVKLAFAPGQDPAALEEWERSFPDDYLLPKAVPSPPSDRQPKTWENVSDEEIDNYMRRVSHTSLHFAGTCPMSIDNKSGVVDQSLRVHGFTNLRIADTSVFPKIPSCHTMAPVMAVAERCADMVKATWKEKKSH
ncbi:choline dehydrogenase [Metarhizium guizhouense ARSEF 977]|uniref:Choline dehydrogenase n=1 Tax=Metarhizium guizhouense (strain ARSEF 977) TaxID=1276136 RepID=A0A0B4HWI1_METGA|nr:choline dehydrogenase [Metarhizium guizhouense ARSEF 977]